MWVRERGRVADRGRGRKRKKTEIQMKIKRIRVIERELIALLVIVAA